MAIGTYVQNVFGSICVLGFIQSVASTMDVCKSIHAKSLSYCQASRYAETDSEEAMKELLGSASGFAPEPLLAQWLGEMMLDFWNAVGWELLIFVITLGFALSARTQKVKRTTQAGEGEAFQGAATVHGAKSLGEPGGSQNSKKDAPPRAAAGLRRRPDASEPDVHHASPSAASIPAASSQGQSPVVPPGREPWRLIDEIVGGCRANPNLRWAHRSIELYQELQKGLREQATTVGEATWYARHSSLDLYTCMIQSVVRTSQCHLVEHLIEDMVRQGVSRPLPFYESTMKQLAVQKHYQLALSVYDRLVADGLSPSVVTLSCLISFAAEVGAYDKAIDFFEQLSKQSKPSIRACMTVLRVHGKRQDWPTSLATFRKMQEQGVPLDSLALNVVLATGIACDKVEEAEMLILEGHKTVPAISDSVSYNTLIKGYMQRSDLSSAMNVVDRMREHGTKPNSITFNTMMDRAMRFNQYKEAWELYGMMRGYGLKADKSTTSILIKGMDTNRAQREHVGYCVELLQESGHLCDAALFSNLSGIVLDLAARAGDPALLAAVQQLRQATPTTWRSA